MADPAGLVSGIMARLRSLWRGLRRRSDVEADMSQEFRHHLELRTDDLIRRGLTPAEAARQARIEFGHIQSHKEDARASRGLRLFDQIGMSWLDMKLGARMLVKYPGLSAVSVIGIAVATAVGAGAFGAIDAVTDPSLPLHEDERVVSLLNADAKQAGDADRQSLHDFVYWRQSLRSVSDLAAFSGARRNLILAGGATEPVRLAQMTASGFRVARVAPVMGRPLLDADERAGAPPVLVIGYEPWKRVFGSDPAIIGRQVHVGAEAHTVVGVMPDGFRFPVSHQYWVALRLDPTAHPVGDGPELFIFGRLADGATFEGAQLELSVLGQRIAAQHPETHGTLRPQVLPYTLPFFDLNEVENLWLLRGLELAVALLLVVVSVNVAILIYARTATRAGEIAVRSALGASRRRIVTQFFAEAFVLSALAAAIGLAVATAALSTAQRFLDVATGGELPFWLELGVSARLILYVAGLAVLAAVIVGVFPAIKATGRDIQAGLQRLGSRGSEMHLGRTWTMLIVLQVAVAVAALPYAVYIAAQSVTRATAAPGYPADEILQASLWYEPEAAAPDAAPSDAATAGAAAGSQVGASDAGRRSLFAAKAAELVRRVEDEPAVAGVASASGFPGDDGLADAEVELEGSTAQNIVRVNQVDIGFLRLLDIRPVAGRDFILADRDAGANRVVVDQTFAETLLPGSDGARGGIVGRRLRYVTVTQTGEVQRGPWLEIVGVVPTAGVMADLDAPAPTLYRPVPLGQVGGVLAVRVKRGTSPAAFQARLRSITAAVDPALHLDELRTATDAERQSRQTLLFIALGVVTITGSVLLLSAAGMYAMMSFTVAKRRREIGIRAALGAAPGHLLRSIFAQASARLGGGVVAGLALAFVVDRAMGGGPLSREGLVLVPSVAALMLAIGLVAAFIPARRGLAVQPTEALRDE